MRYRALPERRRSSASFTCDIGNVSVTGAMECRALNSSISSITTGLPVGEPPIDFCPRIKPKAGHFQRLEDRSDVMQVSLRLERVEQGGNVERGIDRGNDDVQASRQLFQRVGLFLYVNEMGAELPGFRFLVIAGREGVDFAAPLVRKLQCHVAQPADADDTDARR